MRHTIYYFFGKMALYFLAWELMILQERVNHVDCRLHKRTLRDAQNPYELPRNEFLRSFRISPELAMHITDSMRPFLERVRTTGLASEIQVLVAINFDAHGSYQRPAGDRFDFAISPSSVSRCLHAVTDLINRHLLRPWVKFPTTQEQRQAARMKFLHAPQPFEGAIDCTYVNILTPAEHEEAFVNHHQNHSLNVQAIVDTDMKILNINARYPGARNNSYIWSVSPIRRVMEYNYNRGERHTWLIGDAGYPLEPWLLTPLPNYPPGTRQFQYTEELCKARNVVKRFFGVLKGTWRCMSYRRVLMYAPDFAGRIVNACAVIHNMCIHHCLPLDDFHNEEEAAAQQNGDNKAVAVERREAPRAIAQHLQHRLMQPRFPHLEDADRNDDQ